MSAWLPKNRNSAATLSIGVIVHAGKKHVKIFVKKKNVIEWSNKKLDFPPLWGDVVQVTWRNDEVQNVALYEQSDMCRVKEDKQISDWFIFIGSDAYSENLGLIKVSDSFVIPPNKKRAYLVYPSWISESQGFVLNCDKMSGIEQERYHDLAKKYEKDYPSSASGNKSSQELFQDIVRDTTRPLQQSDEWLNGLIYGHRPFRNVSLFFVTTPHGDALLQEHKFPRKKQKHLYIGSCITARVKENADFKKNGNRFIVVDFEQAKCPGDVHVPTPLPKNVVCFCDARFIRFEKDYAVLEHDFLGDIACHPADIGRSIADWSVGTRMRVRVSELGSASLKKKYSYTLFASEVVEVYVGQRKRDDVTKRRFTGFVVNATLELAFVWARDLPYEAAISRRTAGGPLDGYVGRWIEFSVEEDHTVKGKAMGFRVIDIKILEDVRPTRAGRKDAYDIQTYCVFDGERNDRNQAILYSRDVGKVLDREYSIRDEGEYRLWVTKFHFPNEPINFKIAGSPNELTPIQYPDELEVEWDEDEGRSSRRTERSEKEEGEEGRSYGWERGQRGNGCTSRNGGMREGGDERGMREGGDERDERAHDRETPNRDEEPPQQKKNETVDYVYSKEDGDRLVELARRIMAIPSISDAIKAADGESHKTISDVLFFLR